MALDLTLPIKFESLYQDGDADYRFNVSNFDLGNEIDTNTMIDELEAFQDSSDRLQSGSLTQGVINDIFFWCLKEFTTLAADMKLCLVDCLTDSAKYVCDQLNEGLTTNQKNNAKKLLFYFVQLCLKAEADATSSTTTSMTDKTKGKGTKTKRSQSNSGYDWKIQRLDCLLVLEDIVSAKLGQLWSMGIVEEAFTNPIWKYCVELLESKAAGISGSSHIEGQGRQRCVEVIAQSTSHFGSTLTSGSYCALATALMDTMIHHEHMIVYVADICRIEHHSYKTQHLSTEIMTEISKMNFSALSSTSIKNVSSFVEAFARLDTMSFIPFIAILVKQVDSPAYPMRSAMLQALGHVIQWIHDVLTGKTSFSDGQTSAEDAADGGRHSELLIRQRDSLLNMMIERTHDVNPYTRSCLLKVWMQLIESQSLPIKRIGSIAEVAVDRLLDRNYLVRRAAIALLTSIIDSNPFASQLEHDIFANQKEEVLKLMEQRYDELSENTGRKALEDVDVDSTLVTAANKKKHDEGMPSKGRRNMSALPTPEQALLAATGEDDEEDEDELDEEELIADAKQDDVMQELRQRLDYLQSALELISAIHIAIPRIASMLESKTTSDVTESVHFFNRAVNFQLHGTLDHFKNAFKLIWHQDASIQSELKEAFTQVYLTNGSKDMASNTFLPADEIALNLMRLIQQCVGQHSEMISLERLIAEVVTQSCDSEEIVSALREKMTSSYHKLQQQHRSRQSILAAAGQDMDGLGIDEVVATAAVTLVPTGAGCSDLSAALYAIGMILSSSTTPAASTTNAEDNLALIRAVVNYGLGNAVHKSADCHALKASAILLQKLPFGQRHLTSTSSAMNVVFHEVVTALVRVLTMVLEKHVVLTNLMVSQWFAASEEVLHALYKLHGSPDTVLSSILKYFYAQVTAYGGQCPSLLMACFVFLVGQTALNTVVYAEALGGEVKKRARVASEQKEKAANKAGATEGQIEDFEEQMGLQQQLDAEFEQELAHLIEYELVLDSFHFSASSATPPNATSVPLNPQMLNLLAQFIPMIRYIVANDTKQFSHPVLRNSAIISLSRSVTLSLALCEQNLPLLFTILANTKECVNTRTSLLVGIADLAFRFPNALEPWTRRLYQQLYQAPNAGSSSSGSVAEGEDEEKDALVAADEHVIVRYNALMVITHLVLNDMIKVKGHIVYIVLCLSDSNVMIRDLARLFFLKLSERAHNPLFNLLGDIIANLSHDPTDTKSTTTSSGTDGEQRDPVFLSEDAFHHTMHFLLSFVTSKEKHGDVLFERLLVRLAAAETKLQRQYLAFCISELSISEKALKKLIEQVKNIKMALQDEVVYEYFKILLAKTKKSSATAGARNAGADQAAMAANAAATNPDGSAAPAAAISKSLLEEAERALEAAVSGQEDGIVSLAGDEATQAGGEDAASTASSAVVSSSKAAATATAASKSKAAAKKTANAKKKVTAAKKKVKKYESSSGEEDNGNSDDEEVAPKAASNSRGKRGAATNRKIYDDDDEEL